jgi:hypothetical protein
MVAIAIFSVDPVLRCSLEQLPREDPAITVVGIVDSPSALVELAETQPRPRGRIGVDRRYCVPP